MTFPRQPANLVISPSNQSPWVGWTDAPGARFTRMQVHIMRKLGLDPETVDAITVYREATAREMWWSTGSPPPVFQFDCPVLGHRADGKVKVIAPNGENKFVLPNGWVREPSRGNRHLAVLAAQRATAVATGLGAVLLASMLIRAVIAAQPSPAGASHAQPVPPAPVVEAGRSQHSQGDL